MVKKLFCCLLVLGVLGVVTPVTAAPPTPQVGAAFVQEGRRLSPCYTGCGGVTGVPSSNEAYEQEVVEMVNEIRLNNNPPLPPLKRAAALDDAARYHATDMGVDNYFPNDPLVSHATYDRDANKKLLYVCACDERVETYYDFIAMAENSAAGQSTPTDVMNSWMNSTGHRNNILSTSNWEIGVGYYQGSGDYYRYWNQDFGRREGVYPIVINREAAETDNYEVNLYIYGSGAWDEMRLRNDDGNWTDWQMFQNEFVWGLPQVVGMHTVWVALRRGGQTTTSSDSIYLTKGYVAPTLNDLPDELTFTYDAATGQLTPPLHVVTLTNITSPAAITWTLAAQGTWFAATPASGVTPGTFAISPTTFITNRTATYSGVVTVTATNPDDTANPVQQIDLTLEVIAKPTLGDLPDALSFTYHALQDEMAPPTHSLQLKNVITEDPIQWEVMTSGDWFTASALTGETPATLLITPTMFITDQLKTYTGAIMVTAVSPTTTVNAVQHVALSLDVRVPTLGALPDKVPFVYSIQTGRLRPASYTITPRNVGSEDALQWSVSTDARWAQITPTTGTTPQSFTVTPLDFSTMVIFLYTGTITVTVDSPTLVGGSPYTMPLTLDVVEVDILKVYLPLVLRDL
ncbi:MAG: CAP domain-containing protein [Anaerolineae bacterium]|nr:CAP domain-containing protein [Anaerolineae bacterium]